MAVTHSRASVISHEAETQQRLQASCEVVAALAARPRGLFTDIDGTISPITTSPEAASLLPGIRDLLLQARSAFDVVGVISGRAVPDAVRLVQIPQIIYVGSHGLQQLDPADTRSGRVEDAIRVRADDNDVREIAVALARIEAALSQRLPGMMIEHKQVSGSIHVRNTPDPDAAEELVFALAREVAVPRHLRVTRGKRVVEILPSASIDKGTTLTRLVQEHHLASVFYLGDDRSDIDAFAALKVLGESGETRGVSIAVLHEEAPEGLADKATVVLDSVEMVPAALRWLVAHAS